MALKEGTEKGKENEGEIRNAELLAIVAQLQKDLAEMKKEKSTPTAMPMSSGMSPEQFKQFIEATKESNKKELDYEEGIYEEDIPTDDYDEEGVRFCAPFVGYVIVDDVRKGKRVKLPWGKKSAFFEYAATRKIQQGKYEATAPFSVYRSHSKKEIKWLREHTNYNLMFYESSTDAVNVDLLKIQKLGRIMTLLKNYELHDILKRCREYEVPISEDAARMRMQLAYKMADRELESEGIKAKQTLEATSKEALILGQE